MHGCGAFVYLGINKKVYMELLTPSAGLILWIVLLFLTLLLPILAVVSLLRSEYRDSTTKLIWLIAILFVPLAGPILYYVIGRKQRVKVA